MFKILFVPVELKCASICIYLSAGYKTSSIVESVRLEARFKGKKHEWRISPMKTLDFAAVCKWNVLLKSAGGSKGIGVVTQHCNEIVHCFSQIRKL